MPSILSSKLRVIFNSFAGLEDKTWFLGKISKIKIPLVAAVCFAAVCPRLGFGSSNKVSNKIGFFKTGMRPVSEMRI